MIFFLINIGNLHERYQLTNDVITVTLFYRADALMSNRSLESFVWGRKSQNKL